MENRGTTYSTDEFLALVRRESDDVELKTGVGRRPLHEAMVAFSNSGGGTIFIGVTDDRRITGRRRDQGTDDAIHEAALEARSLGRYSISTVLVDDTEITVVDVDARPDEVAQTSDGRVLQRRGGRNVPVFGSDLWELMSRRALRRYEHADSGVPVDQVDDDLLSGLGVAYHWNVGAPDLVDRLRERQLVHGSGRLTIAGALVLTDPVTTLHTSKFHVDIRTYESDETRSYVRRERVGGPVQRQVEEATTWVIRDIGTEMVVTDAVRHDLPRLPRRVVREAVANAVAHRDYASDRSPVVIEVRPSYVRITSPGELPAPVTLTTLREAQSPRNHSVIDVLRRLGLAEDSGQGIDVIQDGMRHELLAEPEFAESSGSFVVTLRLAGLVSTQERAWLSEHERQGRLRTEERPLLLHTLREGRTTNAAARDLLNVDSVEARQRLQRLRDTGLLVQHGTRGRSYYTLGVIGPDRSVEEVLLDAAVDAPLTNERVRQLSGLTRDQARALLGRMVAEGRLVRQGERRGTRYTLP